MQCETGAREDSSALLNQLKRNFKNQRITASDILASKDIANTLSDFKDLVVENVLLRYDYSLWEHRFDQSWGRIL